jgi:2,3-bisphosphoglycerate-independent phosphoglycerate mutase
MEKKVLLLILDGWGLSEQNQYSAIAQAHTPFIDKLYQKYPHTTLEASGMAVGLPNGQMGNSEVGHLHIGAGRIIPQSLVRIDQAIEFGELAHNLHLLAALAKAKQDNKKIHLLGLVSDGGVHAHVNHLKALCRIAEAYGVKQVFIHAFTDGRDTNPHKGLYFLSELVNYLQPTSMKLASIIGRYYAMDRDQHWERTQLAYDALVHGQGLKTEYWENAMQKSYSQGITDEFIQPIIVSDQDGLPLATIQAGDIVICFNFRADRMRQLIQALTQGVSSIPSLKPLALDCLTMTAYDDRFESINSIVHKEHIQNSLGEVLSQAGKTQLRVAETEKYPHITYFFSGGREAPFPGEQRILCPSPNISTYDQRPEMAAWDITSSVKSALQRQSYDFVCVNLANPDMVGHSGNLEATIKACEVVDACVEKIIETALEKGYLGLLVADHGNAEQMLSQSGSPYTAHTTNLVPCILLHKEYHAKLYPGKLADLAPTILEYMELPIPKEMTGTSLFKNPNHII